MNNTNHDKQAGYAYRQCPLDETALRLLMTSYVLGETTYAFAASSVEYQPIKACKTIDDVQFMGNNPYNGETGIPLAFGHVFSPRAEVRWKRREDHTYDALVLSENEIPDLKVEALDIKLYIREPKNKNQVGILLRHKVHLSQGKGNQLVYVEYVAANGAVQFVRYKSVR
jgi:hypothetical protein